MEFKKNITYHIGKFKDNPAGIGIIPVGSPLILPGDVLIERYNSRTFDDYMNQHAFKDYKPNSNISVCTRDNENNEYEVLETRTVIKPMQVVSNNQNTFSSPLQDAGQAAFQKELHNDFKQSLAKQLEILQESNKELVIMNEQLRNAKQSAEEKAMITESSLLAMTAKHKASAERVKELTEQNRDLLDRLENVNRYYDQKVEALQDSSTANLTGLLDNPAIQGLLGMATQIATPFIHNFADNMKIKQEKQKLELEMMKQKLDPHYKSPVQNMTNPVNPASQESDFEMEI